MKFYLLEHEIKYGKYTEGKMIGVCSSREKAIQLVEEYKKLPGFEDHKENFKIKEMKLDKGKYKKGFKSWYKMGRGL